MNVKSRRFKAVDMLLLLGTILPLVGAIVVKVLTAVPSDEINITGAQIYFTIPMPLQPLYVTEAQVVSAAVVLTILFLCLYLTHGIAVVPNSKRQLVAEWLVEKCQGMVDTNMGAYFKGFGPFVGAVMILSALSSLSSLLGLFPPTSDINIVGGWALLVFGLITYYKMKGGVWLYAKSFAQPVPFLLPMNIISEAATPISMSFRHYGNILSGSIISALLAAAFAGLTNLLLGWITPILGNLELLRIGIPAVLSLYFDIFSGGLQAFIFATLTMMYISGGFPQSEFEARKAKREAKKKAKQEAKSVKAA